MITKTSGVKSPTGLSRLLFRLPIYLYRWNLGWLLGGRFLLINHVGRKSGKKRQAVVEVVRYDNASDTYVVASGFGPEADWYRNLQKQPDVTIQVGRRKLDVIAEFLTPAEGAQEMVDYAHRHPTAARNLSKLMGYQVDGSEADYRKLGRELPFVVFRPKENLTQSRQGVEKEAKVD